MNTPPLVQGQAEACAALADKLTSGDRRALARAITLVESTREDDRALADLLLARVLPSTGKAMRIGLSGTPGVGKSTFIETLGTLLCDAGKRLAVLAVDPSSPTSGGSLLGDKTRMERLSRHEHAFVRPQPSSGTLGGTAPHTRDAIILCEAAGFDVVIVETVGVGQSEHAVADLIDTFVLLVAPGGGDELQAVKRGVLELVDVLVVNKADGTRIDEARRTREDYQAGSRLFLAKGLTPGSASAWQVPVLLASAKESTGIGEVYHAIESHRRALTEAKALGDKRAAQAERAMWRAVEDELLRGLRSDTRVLSALPALVSQVRALSLSPSQAARALVDKSRG